MASFSENMNTVNRVLKYFHGHESEDAALEILLVSSNPEYLAETQKVLYTTKQIQTDKRMYRLKVHTCKHIEDVLNSTSNEYTVDFIVLILDVKNENCFSNVRSNMSLLQLHFPREKICLLNPYPKFDSAIKLIDVWDFASRNQINLIIGRFTDSEAIFHLSKKILNLAEHCCGITNGLPLIGDV